jgi:long-chain acyl-CoA synthetase
LEKIYNVASSKASSPLANKVFKLATYYSQEYAKILGGSENEFDAEDVLKPDEIGKRLGHFVSSRLVYNKIKQLLGGNLEFVVSGGAPLSNELALFYKGMGITVLEGYGLTETTGPCAVNRTRTSHIGSTGMPVPGTTVRIAEDSEVLIKGPGVFKEYIGANTRDFFDEDGFYKSGDIGRLDPCGRLYITGRKKEILVTAGGKNVIPTILEDRLRGHPLVSQCLVVADQRPFVAALITLDAEMLPVWLKLHGQDPDLNVQQARANPVVLESLRKGVERVNSNVSRAESIRKFLVLASDWTEDNAYLTPSQKMKRQDITRDFAPEIEQLYSGNGVGIADV